MKFYKKPKCRCLTFSIIILIPNLVFSYQHAYIPSQKQYLLRFDTYEKLSNDLNADLPNLIKFIQSNKPLSTKLRNKYLYKLAESKSWQEYLQYYRPSNDISLKCYETIAKYNTGSTFEAQKSGKALWRTGHSMPPACDALFKILLADHTINNNLIQERINLALNINNFKLFHYLAPKVDAASNMRLYALQQILKHNVDTAVTVWQHEKNGFSPQQTQIFFKQVFIFKTLRQDQDAIKWFNKILIKPRDEGLQQILEWRLRLALLNKDWSYIKKNIRPQSRQAQYWLARALMASGDKTSAVNIYKNLALTLDYYGILASKQIKQKPAYYNLKSSIPKHDISIYQPILQDIKHYYKSGEIGKAAQLVNDFSAELIIADKKSFAYWLMQDLHWYIKAIEIANHDPALHHDFNLRFPLAYKNIIHNNAKVYNIPEALIYAMIRQESAFQDKAKSSVGANGIMQIMRGTAKIMAKRLGIKYKKDDDLFNITNNIHIGSAYIKDLKQSFHDNIFLISAAYNAGPAPVKKWHAKFSQQDFDIWVETIPFMETRDYVKNVYAFYKIYEYRIGKDTKKS
jgi:soluble lytic murein transglycosylase